MQAKPGPNPGQSSPGKTLKILPQNVSETGGRRGGDSTKFQRVFTARNGKGGNEKNKRIELKKVKTQG